MYSDRLSIYLTCGDIFAEVPIPVVGMNRDLIRDAGPAMAVDHDCQICKRRGIEAFNFAPLRPLENFDGATQGNIKRNRVRHLLYLPEHERLGDEEWCVDLSELFSLPRGLFNLNSVYENEDPAEHRWEMPSNEGINERVLALVPDGIRSLMLKFVDLLRLWDLVSEDPSDSS